MTSLAGPSPAPPTGARATGPSAPPVSGRTPRVVIATVMRPHGGSGVQSHMRTLCEYAGGGASLVTPFASRSPWLRPAFALRFPLRLLNAAAGVWWYRAGHAHFLARALRAHLAAHPDAVIYAQCPVSAGVALRVRTTQPVVLAVHFNLSQADEWAGKGEIAHGGRLFRSIRAFERHVLGRLDGLVYVSEDSRRRLEARVPATCRVPSVVIGNAVPGPAPRTGPPPLTGDLITIGSLEPRKNHRYLLEILAQARRLGYRYTLTVVGSGPARGSLEKLAAQLGIADAVRFAGFRADARDLLPGHRAYVHTAVEESFGIALVEAMGAGLPVVAAPVGGIPELVQDGVEGLYWPLDDGRAAAQTLISLLEAPERHAAMSTAALRRAEEFTPERLGPRLLTFLYDVGRRPGLHGSHPA